MRSSLVRKCVLAERLTDVLVFDALRSVEG